MYVIAGVTGRTGGVAAKQLLASGKPVRVIVREPSRGQPWRQLGAEVAVASLDDPTALAQALDGATGAYLLCPASLASADPVGDGWRTSDAVARAIDRSRLPHLVFLSSMGASQAEGTGIVRGLHAAEVRLREATTAISFIRASYFMDQWLPVLGAAAGGALPTFLRPDRVMPMVATRDVGALVARTLIEGPPAGGREILRMRGPREVSPDDLARTLTELLGRPVAASPVPLEALPATFASFGASPAFAEQTAQLYRCINDTEVMDRETDGRLVRGPTDAKQLFREALARAAPTPALEQ